MFSSTLQVSAVLQDIVTAIKILSKGFWAKIAGRKSPSDFSTLKTMQIVASVSQAKKEHLKSADI